MNKHIINKRKEVIASERYIKFIIKHQNKLHRRYYSSNVPKKYKVVNVLRARKLMYKGIYRDWQIYFLLYTISRRLGGESEDEPRSLAYLRRSKAFLVQKLLREVKAEEGGRQTKF